jgi:hypothetical protein
MPPAPPVIKAVLPSKFCMVPPVLEDLAQDYRNDKLCKK